MDTYGIKRYLADEETVIYPVTLAEAKLHIRKDEDNEDDLITALIIAATEWAENYTNRQFITATYDLWLDNFPMVGLKPNPFVFIDESVQLLRLPKAPLQEVDYIKYYDVENVLQTFDEDVYKVDNITEPGRILPRIGNIWPVTIEEINAVNIRFSCGYGDEAANVPFAIKQAILLIVGDTYSIREETIVGTIATPSKLVERLLTPFKIIEL